MQDSQVGDQLLIKCPKHRSPLNLIHLTGTSDKGRICSLCSSQKKIPYEELLGIDELFGQQGKELLSTYPPFKEHSFRDEITNYCSQNQDKEAIDHFFDQVRYDIEMAIQEAQLKVQQYISKNQEVQDKLLEEIDQIAEFDKLRELVQSGSQNINTFLQEKWNSAERNESKIKQVFKEGKNQSFQISDEKQQEISKIINQLQEFNLFAPSKSSHQDSHSPPPYCHLDSISKQNAIKVTYHVPQVEDTPDPESLTSQSNKIPSNLPPQKNKPPSSSFLHSEPFFDKLSEIQTLPQKNNMQSFQYLHSNEPVRAPENLSSKNNMQPSFLVKKQDPFNINNIDYQLSQQEGSQAENFKPIFDSRGPQPSKSNIQTVPNPSSQIQDQCFFAFQKLLSNPSKNIIKDSQIQTIKPQISNVSARNAPQPINEQESVISRDINFSRVNKESPNKNKNMISPPNENERLKREKFNQFVAESEKLADPISNIDNLTKININLGIEHSEYSHKGQFIGYYKSSTLGLKQIESDPQSKKKEAQKDAARKFWPHLKFYLEFFVPFHQDGSDQSFQRNNSNNDEQSFESELLQYTQMLKNYQEEIVKVSELVSKFEKNGAIYALKVDELPHEYGFMCQLTFKEEFITEGIGSSKKNAKQIAYMKMYPLLMKFYHLK